jgi:hypothetical protein
MFKNLTALSRSYNLTCLYITLATIIGELYKPFKASLASLTGHHWISKGVTALIIFIVLTYLLGNINEKNDLAPIKEVFTTTIIYSIVMVAFFIIFYSFH